MIQFVATVHAVKKCLNEDGYEIIVSQSKPLSVGEVLGCTALRVLKNKNVDALVFVADERFHLKALMIANPRVLAFQFDPFLGTLVLEEYDHEGMKRERREQSMSLSGECGSCDYGKGADDDEDYSMDYYAQDGGEWNGSYVKKKVVGANATNCCTFSGGKNKQR